MLQQLVWFLHIVCALSIIMLVLVQYGKGTDMGTAMGGASQTIFGSSGSGSFLTKLTTIFALIFAITSISLSFFMDHKPKDKIISEMIKTEEVENNTLPDDNQEEINDFSESINNKRNFNRDLDLPDN